MQLATLMNPMPPWACTLRSLTFSCPMVACPVSSCRMLVLPSSRIRSALMYASLLPFRMARQMLAAVIFPSAPTASTVCLMAVSVCSMADLAVTRSRSVFVTVE